MVRNEHFLQIAESLKPELYRKKYVPTDTGFRQLSLKKGDTLRLDSSEVRGAGMRTFRSAGHFQNHSQHQLDPMGTAAHR